MKKYILTIALAISLLLNVVAALLLFQSSQAKPTTKQIKKPTTMVERIAGADASTYSVKGIDISNHSGAIDWAAVDQEDIQFVFMKATEGTTFQDKRFAENWQQARKTNLKIGAYHFLSYDSTGASQAENFIATVPKMSGMLPPVVDIEYELLDVLPTDEEVHQIIKEVVTKLEKHYGVKPILYVNYKSYARFVENQFDDYPIWLCDINQAPAINYPPKWTFWQHSHTGTVKGIEGNTVDLNVYQGTYEEFIKQFKLAK